MLGVFLGILKIIGITLLVILLIIIALLLIVLFVPIRYKAHAVIDHCDLDDENLDFKEKVSAEAGFTWLLHLVRGGIGYPENKEFWVKVLFFKILPKSEDAKKKKEEKQRKKDRKNSKKKLEQALENASDAQEIGPEDRKDGGNGSASNEADSIGGSASVSENSVNGGKTTDSDGNNSTVGRISEGKAENNGETENSTDNAVNTENSGNAEGSGNAEAPENPESPENPINTDGSGDSETSFDEGSSKDGIKRERKRKSSRSGDADDDGVDIFTVFDFFEKLSDLFWGTLDFLEKPEKAVEKAFYTISRACDKIDLIQDTLESPTFERAYRCAKKDLFLILRHVKPKKFNADILLGLGDPATTAQVLAAVNVADAFLDYDIDLEPDFDNKVVEADVDIRGRIALWRVLLSAARVYFNKDIRKVYKRINRIISK